jgi:hypothetical protein
MNLPAETDICKYLFYERSERTHIHIEVKVDTDGEVEAYMKIAQPINARYRSKDGVRINLARPTTAQLLILMCLDRGGVLDSVANELGKANAVLERVRDVLRSVYTAAKILMQ